jgi:pimeloyl-ACP methyl ester carboxylesterase
MSAVRERAVQFGNGAWLVGVLSEPRQEATAGVVLPAVVMLNAGILHHVGPSRLHVALARRLVEDGYTSLRFDFSGIGDSEPRRDGMPFDQAAVLEVKDAMNFLGEKRDINKFIVLGLCSGADVAFRTAKDDSRVVGLVSIDGYAYRNLQYYLHHYVPRLVRLGAWKSFTLRQLRRGLRSLGLGRIAVGLNGRRSTFVRPFPPKEEVELGLRSLIDRGVEQLYIYSGGQEEYYNYEDQFADTFRSVEFRGRVRVEYLSVADHTFTSLDQQAHVIDTIVDWLNVTYASVP